MSREGAAGTGPLEAGSRELVLASTFVSLADTLVDDYDVVDLLDRLVAACIALIGVTSAGLLVDDQQGGLVVVASSTEETRLVEVFQVQSDEGPCLDCFRDAAPVECSDLESAHERWPHFVPVALEAGFRSVVAVPLRLRRQTIGALNLFRDTPIPVPEGDRRLAQALADVATIGILQRRSVRRSSEVAEQLQHALSSRIVIEQAKGVLAERDGLPMSAAFDALRGHARQHNLKLTDVAHAVVGGELDPARVVGAPRVRSTPPSPR